MFYTKMKCYKYKRYSNKRTHAVFNAKVNKSLKKSIFGFSDLI